MHSEEENTAGMSQVVPMVVAMPLQFQAEIRARLGGKEGTLAKA
jgi:hypothetical protein